MINTDLIIVGQGLAGSVLALKCIEQGYSVIVIDKPELSSCSKVAAGIWNPVVFKRLTKSWMIDELLPELLQFYRQAEKTLSAELITEREIIKLFSEQQEIELWKKKANGELENYLDKTIYSQNEMRGIKNSSFGYSKVLKAGNLEVKKFLELTRNYLIGKKSFLEEKFENSQLKVSEIISYKNIHAKQIIFADGYLIKQNPYFNYIPFKPAKGEVLTISSDDLKIGNSIVNKNAFVMQTKNGKYKLGATYDWENLNDITTQGALRELEDRFEKLSDANYKVINHKAGVRPSVIDRRPVLGSHPIHKNMFVFNGFGTKGVMLAPYFAQKLINFIKFNEALQEDVNVTRFNKFFVN
jgi:glycine/D-amino acid oxidase-like deaminating enzyme